MIKKNILFTFIFNCMDKVLPRKIARWPYDEAHNYLLIQFARHNLKAKIWTRNSVRHGNFVFGVSDLDLSVLFDDKSPLDESKTVLSILREAKELFPFLGECNFYNSSLIGSLFVCGNYYELKRDPDLINFTDIELEVSKLDQIVFLLRMMYYDSENLKLKPSSRQKKWMKHFNDLGLEFPDSFTSVALVKLISNLIIQIDKQLNLEELESAIGFLFTVDYNEARIFNINKPKYWKYLFPHRQLWFETNELDIPSEVKGTALGDICLRQIDWEVWGLMSQKVVIKDLKYGFYLHLERLKKVAVEIENSPSTSYRVDVLLRSN